MRWIELTSPDAAGVDINHAVGLVPVGSVEQHSRHLPLGTDSFLVEAVASRAEAERPLSVLLLPSFRIGASSHHLGFAGTASLPSETVAEVLDRTIQSLEESTGLSRFLVLNGHGGNEPAVRIVCERAGGRPGVRVVGTNYWTGMLHLAAERGLAVPAEGMQHACLLETSMMLSIKPELVHMELAEADGRTDGLPAGSWISTRWNHVTDHGGIGDPTAASIDLGRSLISAAVDSVVEFVDLLTAADDGQ